MFSVYVLMKDNSEANSAQAQKKTNKKSFQDKSQVQLQGKKRKEGKAWK